MLKTLAYALSVTCVALGLGVFLAAQAPPAPTLSISRIADTPAPPGISTRAYFVTNSQGFPSLASPPNSLVFLNGLYQTAGVDYDVTGGVSFRFRTGALSNGDRIAVVTLP